MTTTGPREPTCGRELTLCEGKLICGDYQTAAQGVVTEPDEAVSRLLDGHAVTVTPRIVAAVTQTIAMLYAAWERGAA